MNALMKWLRVAVTRTLYKTTALGLAALLALAIPAWADRTHLKPGFNLYSQQQDVQVGQQFSHEAERQFPMLNDARVDAYLNNLGKRLASKAPYGPYPYQFRAVNDRAINAFALPGGYVYINRGVIEAADNEAQLAGVMAHEISHVALRHGTNQASKAEFWQLGLGAAGGLVGGGTVGGLLTQVGGGFLANSVLLKYSRDAERQADVMGTQILYDSNYDPRAMAQFFEKIEAESKGKTPAEFFSNHPNPEHRVERVTEEVDKLGGPPKGYKTDSAEFREIRRYVLSLPPPPKGRMQSPSGSGRSGRRPSPPSESFQDYQGEALRLRYPDNWQARGQGSAASFSPDGGIVQDSQGNPMFAYGVLLNVYEPHGNATLEDATDQLISDLQRSNPNMRVTRRHERMSVDRRSALSTLLSNDSPIGGRETDWLVGVLRPEGLVYMICVAPEQDYGDYDRAFQYVVDSIRFPR